MKRQFQNSNGVLSLEMAASEANLDIFGDIGSYWKGITKDQFAEAMDAAKDAAIINVRIHSYGGDLFDGVFMYNLLKTHPAEKRGSVLGMCASAATLPFAACSVRKMGNGTNHMIHNAIAGLYGYAKDLRKTADDLDQISDEAARLYHIETGKDLEEIKAMMLAETYMTPEKAIEFGFATGLIDEPVEAPQLATSPFISNFKNIPEEAKRFLNTGNSGSTEPVKPPEEAVKPNFAAIDHLKMRLAIREREMKGRL